MSKENKKISSDEASSPPPDSGTWRIDLKSYKQQDFDPFEDNFKTSDSFPAKSLSSRKSDDTNTTASMFSEELPKDKTPEVRFVDESPEPISTVFPPTPLVPDIIVNKIEPSAKPKNTREGRKSLGTIRSTNSDDLVDFYRSELEQQVREQKQDVVDARVPLEENQKINRPEYILWKQQKLPAWQPIYRPANVIGSFIAMGIALLAFGTYMLLSTLATHEYVIDYTDCRWEKHPNLTCAEVLERKLVMLEAGSERCQCIMKLVIDHDLQPPLFLYYSLDGFYQNHRRYVSSVDPRQLIGRTDLTLASIQSYCSPYSDIKGQIIGPCGAIANSFFTDTYGLKQMYSPESKITINEHDIAWPTDKAYRFRNPPEDFMKNLAKPINWTENVIDLENHYQNEHLIVWMRTAAFPVFRKLWGNVDFGEILAGKKKGVMPKGEYKITIDYNYQTVFANKLRIPKKIILSNTSWLGGRNLFLPYLYLATGGMCLVFGIFFIVLVRFISRKAKRATETEYGAILTSDRQVRAFANKNFDGYQNEERGLRPDRSGFDEEEEIDIVPIREGND